MTKDNINEYSLPCVKCPFCKEIVEAKVIETFDLKKIFCPTCKTIAEYPIANKNK